MSSNLRDGFGGAIPASLMSGYTAPERLREAQESGYHLLHKPVRPMRLRAMLNQMLKTPPGRRRRLKEDDGSQLPVAPA